MSERIAVIASVVVVLLATALSALFYFAPALFFELFDPKGPTIRQALGSLAATIATAAFTKYIVQHESRVTHEQVEKAAMEALQTDARSIVSAYVTVQEEYKDAAETSPTLADRAAHFIGRKRAIINGIDQMNWGTLLLLAGSEGIHAHLQFLSQMIPPNKVGPISQYLQHRMDFAFALRQASSDGQLAELYMLLFSEVEELSLVDTMPLLDTRVKAYYVLGSLERLLEAMRNLNLSVDHLDATMEKARFAYHRLDGYFEPEDDAELPSA